MVREPDRAELERILRETRTVAVLGAHREPHRPAYYVPAYLSSVGYRVFPVNPVLVGQRLFGEEIRARLDQLVEPIDLVDVFRRPADVSAHVDEILGMVIRPRVVWLQQGIRNDRAAERLEAEGIRVVQDRCTLADHRAFRIAP